VSLHYLVKHEIAICGTQSVVFAILTTLMKLLIGTQLDRRKSSAHVQQSKCSKCCPLARTYATGLERHSAIALLITLCFMSTLTTIRRCISSSTPLLRSGRRGPASAPISCSQLDSGLGNLEAREFFSGEVWRFLA